jgi:hypothetical protein
MIVVVDRHGIRVEQPDDFGHLHISTQLDDEALGGVLKRHAFGDTFAGGSAVLDVESMREMARATATSTDWDEGWLSMVGYATDHGWITEDGRGVQVHVERESLHS